MSLLLDTELAFYAGVYSAIHFEKLKQVKVLDLPDRNTSSMFLYIPSPVSNTTRTAYINEFAYWLDVKSDASELEWLDTAFKLGVIAGAFYTSLVQQALHRGKSHVIDLFKNNIKFHATRSSGSGVSDLSALIGGWVSFRFMFGAG